MYIKFQFRKQREKISTKVLIRKDNISFSFVFLNKTVVHHIVSNFHTEHITQIGHGVVDIQYICPGLHPWQQVLQLQPTM